MEGCIYETGTGRCGEKRYNNTEYCDEHEMCVCPPKPDVVLVQQFVSEDSDEDEMLMDIARMKKEKDELWEKGREERERKSMEEYDRMMAIRRAKIDLFHMFCANCPVQSIYCRYVDIETDTCCEEKGVVKGYCSEEHYSSEQSVRWKRYRGVERSMFGACGKYYLKLAEKDISENLVAYAGKLPDDIDTIFDKDDIVFRVVSTFMQLVYPDGYEGKYNVMVTPVYKHIGVKKYDGCWNYVYRGLLKRRTWRPEVHDCYPPADRMCVPPLLSLIKREHDQLKRLPWELIFAVIESFMGL